jgi:hypothetical protein
MAGTHPPASLPHLALFISGPTLCLLQYVHALHGRDKEWPTLLFTFNEMHMAGSLLHFYYRNELFVISPCVTASYFSAIWKYEVIDAQLSCFDPIRLSDFFFNLYNPSSNTMTLASTQPLTEISTRRSFCGQSTTDA